MKLKTDEAEKHAPGDSPPHYQETAGQPLLARWPCVSRIYSHGWHSLSWAIGLVTQRTGGVAVAIADGRGSTAHAISTGGYAESVAIGNGAQSKAFAKWGVVDIDRTVVGEDGQARNTHFTSPPEAQNENAAR